MYLRNVGIFVKDLEGARAFFENYFGAKVLKTYDNPAKNYYSYIMELNGPGSIPGFCLRLHPSVCPGQLVLRTCRRSYRN